MYIFVELWNPRPAWIALSKEERIEYVARMNPSIEDFTSRGANFYAWGMNEDKTPQKLDYEYYAVCVLPTKELLKEFQDLVVQAGWYDYFDQVNISGKNVGPEAVINKLTEL